MSQHNQQDQSKELIIKLGHREVTFRRQYETASIINDFLIALWFTLGSIFFSIIR
jgi:YrhK-like protein